jgi:hypothetical protein
VVEVPERLQRRSWRVDGSPTRAPAGPTVKFRPGADKLKALWERIATELGPRRWPGLFEVNASRPFIATSTGTFLEDDEGRLMVLDAGSRSNTWGSGPGASV